MKKYNYVYRIIHLNPQDQRKYYIGVRSCDCLPSLAEKPRPSGRGWIGKKSDCLIYCTIIILKISKYGDFQ